MTLSKEEVETARQPTNDGWAPPPGHRLGCGESGWSGRPRRIRSAATATKPVRPYAHQDEASSSTCCPSRGCGSCWPTSRHRQDDHDAGCTSPRDAVAALVPGKVLVVPPAHLVTSGSRDLWRYFGIDAERIDSASSPQPRPLRDDVDVWVVSVDLLTHNPDVLRKVAGPEGVVVAGGLRRGAPAHPDVAVPRRGAAGRRGRHHLCC